MVKRLKEGETAGLPAMRGGPRAVPVGRRSPSPRLRVVWARVGYFFGWCSDRQTRTSTKVEVSLVFGIFPTCDKRVVINK